MSKTIVLLAAIVAIAVGIVQFTDTSWNIFGRASKDGKATEICANGEIVIIRSLSQLGDGAGKKLSQRLPSGCRVHGPERPKNEPSNLSSNEIRYFHPRDEVKAKSLAEKAVAFAQIEAKLNYLPGLAKSAPKQYHPGYLEVWLR